MPYFPPASGGGAPTTATYLTQTADATLTNEQAMGALATGLVKNATTTGIQSIAVAGTDYAPPITYTAGGADAGQTMAANTVYYVDISGYTADRTYTLPATAAVGDIAGIIVTTGDNAFELLITAAAGDTLNGVAGGTEWSRLFITGEVVLCQCVAANATWIVVQDGRIAMKTLLTITTLCDGESAATFTAPTAAATPGAWTATYDVGNIATTASGTITARRACDVRVSAAGFNKDNGTAGQYFGVRFTQGGTDVAQQKVDIASTLVGYPAVAKTVQAAVDDAFVYQYVSQAGGLGLAVSVRNYFEAEEVL